MGKLKERGVKKQQKNETIFQSYLKWRGKDLGYCKQRWRRGWKWTYRDTGRGSMEQVRSPLL